MKYSPLEPTLIGEEPLFLPTADLPYCPEWISGDGADCLTPAHRTARVLIRGRHSGPVLFRHMSESG